MLPLQVPNRLTSLLPNLAPHLTYTYLSLGFTAAVRPLTLPFVSHIQYLQYGGSY